MQGYGSNSAKLASLSLTDGFLHAVLRDPSPPQGTRRRGRAAMCGEKQGTAATTLGLLNADAKALCLRPDPELVKVFGIPPHRRAVESCPSAGPKEAPVA